LTAGRGKMPQQKDMILSHDTKIVQQIFREAQRGDRGITFNVFNTNVGLQNNQQQEPQPAPEPRRIEAPKDTEFTMAAFSKMLEKFLDQERGDKLRALDALVIRVAYLKNNRIRKDAAEFLGMNYTTYVGKFNRYGIAKEEELR
jgi:hypothetical protein